MDLYWLLVLTSAPVGLSIPEPPIIRSISVELFVKACVTKQHEELSPMSSVEERVRKIVVEQLGVGEDQVTPEASFVDDLGADSLDTVELVMALEEEFNTEIPDEDAEKITTVKQAIDFINENAET